MPWFGYRFSETRGFASQPRDWFAFVGKPCQSFEKEFISLLKTLAWLTPGVKQFVP